MNHSCIRSAVAATLFAMASSGAWSHGKEGHVASTRPYNPAVVEKTDFGQEGDPRKVTRTIEVDMSDAMRFTPSDITVKLGETVRFVVANKGAVLHEMVIGTAQELREHAEQMKKFPDMEHDAPYMAHVKAGMSSDIVWQFTRPGEFHFACLVPGHFEAGMVGKVTVR